MMVWSAKRDHVEFCVPVLSQERMKLGTSNLMCRLIISSCSLGMTNEKVHLSIDAFADREYEDAGNGRPFTHFPACACPHSTVVSHAAVVALHNPWSLYGQQTWPPWLNL